MRAATLGVLAFVLLSAALCSAAFAAAPNSVRTQRSRHSLSFRANAAATQRVVGSASAVSVPDGAGGMYISWAEVRDGSGDIYLLRVTNTGAPAAGWPADGLAVCDAPGDQFQSILMPDGANGAIVAWLDFRNNWQNADGYAQRVNSSGVPQWTANGVKLLTGALALNSATAPDGTGGILVAWTEMGASDVDVFATRYNSSGALATGWSASGNLVCDAAGDQNTVELTNDGAGGAIMTWQDPRTGTEDHIFAQRLNASGVEQWTANGIQLDASANGVTQGALASGPGGAVSVWMDPAAIGNTAFAQYLNTAGAALWTAGGVGIPGSTQLDGWIDCSASATGGVVATWGESPGSVSSFRSQRLDWTGAGQWGSSGIPVVSLANSTPNLTDVVIEGTGITYFMWEDFRNPTSPLDAPDIFAQRVTAAGAASWTANGLAVCTAAGGQYMPTGAMDGSGGLLLVWDDQRRVNTDIYAQRLNSAGVAQFAANGSPVYTNPGVQIGSYTFATDDGGVLIFFQQLQIYGVYEIRSRKFNAAGAPSTLSTYICAYPTRGLATVIDDGNSGAILAWSDLRNGTDGDIYAQRVDIGGTGQWTGNGVAICTATGEQQTLGMVSDGAGGAIIAWQDDRNGGNSDIYAQRVDASGVVQWAANGIAVCSDVNAQQGVVIASDGVGGAIIAWEDSRNLFSPAIYAQRLNGSGVAQWTANGVNIATFTFPSIGRVSAAVMGLSHDAIVLYPVTEYDLVTGAITTLLGAQKVNSAGAPQWGAAGATVCDVSSFCTHEHIVDDGTGGAYVAWSDGRNNVYDVYAQRLDATGALQWTANGVAICNAANPQLLDGLTRDSGGDAYLAWEDQRGGQPDIYAQRVNNAGTVQWAANGVEVCGAARGQYFSSLASWKSASPAREFISWTDNRAGNERYIYMQRLDNAGVVQWTSDGVVSTNLAMVSASADADRVRLQWYSSASVAASVYRRTEEQDWVRVADVLSDGTGMITFEDRDITPGVRYGYRLRYIDQGVQTYAGEVWVDVPGSLALSIEGVRPNPAVNAAAVWFTLPSGDPATLELIDVAGRQVFSRTLTGLSAGRQMLRLEGAVPTSGVYFLRLTQNGRAVNGRAAFLK